MREASVHKMYTAKEFDKSVFDFGTGDIMKSTVLSRVFFCNTVTKANISIWIFQLY